MIVDQIDKFLKYIERAIIVILMSAMLIIVCYATYLLLELVYVKIFIENVADSIQKTEGTKGIQEGLYRMFGSVLTILLGMEIIHTIRIYFAENIVKIELILVISIIAIARHVVQMDYHHVDPLMLIGIASMLAVLLSGYLFMIKLSK